MSLKKNQIEEIEKKLKDSDSDNIIVEEMVNPLFVARMKRYGDMLAEVFNNFLKASYFDDADRMKISFTREQAFELTKIVLDNVLKSAHAELPTTGKTEPKGYA